MKIILSKGLYFDNVNFFSAIEVKNSAYELFCNNFYMLTKILGGTAIILGLYLILIKIIL